MVMSIIVFGCKHPQRGDEQSPAEKWFLVHCEPQERISEQKIFLSPHFETKIYVLQISALKLAIKQHQKTTPAKTDYVSLDDSAFVLIVIPGSLPPVRYHCNLAILSATQNTKHILRIEARERR